MNVAEIKPNTMIEWTTVHGDKQNKTGITVLKVGSVWYCRRTWRSSRTDIMVDECFIVAEHEYREPKPEPVIEQTVFGKYANRLGYSDIEPYEIISEPKEGVKIIRGMKVSDSPVNMEDLQCYPGGFAAHYANQGAQRWDIQPDPESGTFAIRLSKKGDWKAAGGGSKFRLEDHPVKFYDFNF